MGKPWVRHPFELRERVRSLRRDGLSIKQIAAQERLSSSTVSLWVRDILLAEDQIAEIERRRAQQAGIRYSRLMEERREAWREEARDLWQRWSTKPQFQLGIGMYWGEGGKRVRRLTIVNSDPLFITTWLRWCRTYAPAEQIRVEVNVHPNVSVDDAYQFWRSQIDPDCGLRIIRVKLWKREDGETVRLPHGVASVYLSHGAEWHAKMLEWIRLAAVM